MKIKKLALSTVRVLTTDQLSAVQGGSLGGSTIYLGAGPVGPPPPPTHVTSNTALTYFYVNYG